MIELRVDPDASPYVLAEVTARMRRFSGPERVTLVIARAGEQPEPGRTLRLGFGIEPTPGALAALAEFGEVSRPTD